MIRGSTKAGSIANPDPSFFSQQNWDYLCAVSENCLEAKGLTESLKNNLIEWREMLKSNNLIVQTFPSGF